MQFSSLLVVLVGLLAIKSADAWWGRPGFGGWGLGGGFGGLGWGGYGLGWGGYGLGYPYAVYGKREVAEPITRVECVYMTGQNKISCNR